MEMEQVSVERTSDGMIRISQDDSAIFFRPEQVEVICEWLMEAANFAPRWHEFEPAPMSEKN